MAHHSSTWTQLITSSSYENKLKTAVFTGVTRQLSQRGNGGEIPCACASACADVPFALNSVGEEPQ